MSGYRFCVITTISCLFSAQSSLWYVLKEKMETHVFSPKSNTYNVIFLLVCSQERRVISCTAVISSERDDVKLEMRFFYTPPGVAANTQVSRGGSAGVDQTHLCVFALRLIPTQGTFAALHNNRYTTISTLVF